MARTAAFLGHPRDGIIAAWRMYVLTGRVEPPLMRVRLKLGFYYYPALGVGYAQSSSSIDWHRVVSTGPESL
jgi:hypothetical protein